MYVRLGLFAVLRKIDRTLYTPVNQEKGREGEGRKEKKRKEKKRREEKRREKKKEKKRKEKKRKEKKRKGSHNCVFHGKDQGWQV